MQLLNVSNQVNQWARKILKKFMLSLLTGLIANRKAMEIDYLNMP